MNPVLVAWNQSDQRSALDAMLACCAARRWAQSMVALRPFQTVEALSLTADEVWSTMEEPDWMDAFSSHPRIGECKAAPQPTRSAVWSEREQSGASSAGNDVLAQLAAGNAAYEQRFGFTYIVCATGKSADEMLAILQRRLANDRAAELREAAEQQRQITQIRLRKWLME
ncbi:MAG TPA: 2-oxo-4-hydroxy-4-carboxy-5-ureidoimidazoline decarboxylase [Terracidiphilus sp.]